MKRITQESEESEIAVKVDGPRSVCHNVQLIETPVFYLKPNSREYYQIGKTYCCCGSVKRGNSWEICQKPNPRIYGAGTLKTNKYLPQDFTQELWNEMKEIGPGYQEDWGYWITREKGRLTPLTYGNPRPRKQLFELPSDFKKAAAGDSEVPF